MYPPVRPRPKKTSITRSRRGCAGCRRRRTKCDQNEPSCGTCLRLGRVCDGYKPIFRFRFVPSPLEGKLHNDHVSMDIAKQRGMPLDPTASYESIATNFSSIYHPITSLSEKYASSTHSNCSIEKDICISSESVWNMPCSGNTALTSGSAVRKLNHNFGGHIEITAAMDPLVTAQVPGLKISMQYFEMDLFYTTYWESTCLPALHPVFCQVTCLSGSSDILKEAILGLSACNFSRQNPQAKSKTFLPSCGKLVQRPDLTHQTRSLLYYNSAMKKVARLTEKELATNPCLILAAMVLFSYLESSMGNFRGFGSHLQGISAFIEYQSRRVGESLTGSLTVRQVLATWMQPRYLLWWLRTYFSTLEYQQTQNSIPLSLDIQLRNATLHERRISILSILCESHRLSFLDLLRHWKARTKPSSCVPSVTNDARQQTIHSLLELESHKLDEWHARLPLNELPIQSFSEMTLSTIDPNGDLIVEPLNFQSHDAALNYSYYVLARIMQCTNLLLTVDNPLPHTRGNECHDALPWIMILIRIITAVDRRQAIIQNAYTVGFSNVLLTAILRCQSLAVGLWIETWLRSLETLHSVEEGSFPLFQAVHVVRVINEQRRMNVDTFGASQAADDDGGVPKYDAYNSQTIGTLLFHGKSRDTGQLLTTCISVDET